MNGSDTIVVLRHALAGEKLLDPEADFVRGLDDTGRATASALAHELTRLVAPTRLVSSPFHRCTETVAPLAEHLDLPIELRDELGPKASSDEVLNVLLRAQPRTILCTHGEVITRTLPGLTCEKGGAWILRRDTSSLEPVLYLSPPALARAGAA